MMHRILKILLSVSLVWNQSIYLHAEETPEKDDGTAEEIIPEEEELPEEEEASEEEPEETPEETPDTEEITEPEETPAPEETPEPEEPSEEDPKPEEEETPGDEEPEEAGETAETAEGANELDGFLKSLYSVTLSREPAEEELAKWTAQVQEGTAAADIISSIIFSDEFQNHFPDNKSFAAMMYRAILGRAGSEAEVTSWTNRLNSGVSYGKIIQGFVGSPEFKARCSVIGITPGRFVSDLMADRHPAIASFVADIYMNVLRRGCDAPGLENWITALTKGMTGAQIVSSFVESKEFQSSFPDHRTFVQIMYRAVLGRNGSDKEIEGWAAKMDDGQTYRLVMSGFLNSAEFGRKCQAIGIERGTYRSTYKVDVNRAVTKFVMGLYRIFLNRDAEFKGLEGWVGKLLSGTAATEIITGILGSQEFQKKMPSNENFVRMLYRAILMRDGKPEEVSSWAERMNNGQTYRAMMQGFIGSKEFKEACEEMGVKPGSYTSSWYVDKYYSITCFASSFYRIALGRGFKQDELEKKVETLVKKQMSGAQYARYFINSPEFANRNLNNQDYISVLYECVLGRKRKDSSVGSSWITHLENGMTRKTVLNEFLYSAEFLKRCDTLGILKEVPASQTVTQYQPVHYLQKDSRWADMTFNGYSLGATGCVPTSIAMTLSGILDKEILPPAVAQWLYANTNEFGRLAHGGSGAANKYAADHWGVKCYGINTLQKLNEALSNGYIVTAIVGLGYFVATPGKTHEIVLWGSSAGACNVYDPLGTTGKYSIENIFSQLSTDEYDLRGGYVSYAFYK